MTLFHFVIGCLACAEIAVGGIAIWVAVKVARDLWGTK